MEISADITINAPIETVFTVFTDLSKLQERVDDINNVELLEGPAQMKVGTKWKETRTMFGKEATEIMWVTEMVPHERYSVEAESHGSKYCSKYTFTEQSGATHVDFVFTARPQTLMAKILSVLFFFVAGSLKKTLEQDMKNLKSVCEKQT